MYCYLVMEVVYKVFNLDIIKYIDLYIEFFECRRYLGDRVY